jgi:hypothetical protein
MTPLALLDTDTLSEIMKGRDSNVEHFNRIPNLISESWKLP